MPRSGTRRTGATLNAATSSKEPHIIKESGAPPEGKALNADLHDAVAVHTRVERREVDARRCSTRSGDRIGLATLTCARRRAAQSDARETWTALVMRWHGTHSANGGMLSHT
eukprot:9892416-Alexandrium_andersonii.AAC.1